jgi:hypothetical protein
MQTIDHRSQVHRAYDEDVDVTACLRGTFGKRSVDECCFYSIRQRRECGSDDVGCARGLPQHPCDFFEHRAGPVGTVERLIAALLALQQSCLDQTIELANHGARRQAGAPRDLTPMQRHVGGKQQQSQHAAPVAWEKNGC